MKKQLLDTLSNSKDYTLNVLQAMPENLLDFKPAVTVWDFSELFNHITYGIKWWKENYIQGNESAWNPPLPKKHREEIINELKNAFDLLQLQIENNDLTEQAIYGFHSTLDHVTHHRGQAIIYLRCNGITPPEYIY
jgi:uncharacterized damage-inducible protein DinB